MQLEKIDNIVFLKDIESNIMEEAFIVLKNNFNIDLLNNKEKNDKTKTCIIKEAELIINEEVKDADKRNEIIKIKKIQNKYKLMKIINFGLSVAILFLLIF